MGESTEFKALTVESLPERLGSNEAVTQHIGADNSRWKVSEVGDGNLNLVFIV